MKKILLGFLSIVFLSANCAFAGNFNMNSFKSVFNKKSTPVKSEKQVTKDFAKSESAKVKQNDQISEDMSPSQTAVMFYNGNDLKGALNILLSIKECDRTVEDWLLIGNILQDQDRTSDAVFMYNRATMLNPKFYKAYYNLGNIYLDEDKPFMAISAYRKANKSNNQFAYAYYNLGCAYLKTGNLNKAKIVFLKAIELKNTEPDFYFNLAYTYKQLKKEKLSKQYLSIYNQMIAGN